MLNKMRRFLAAVLLIALILLFTPIVALADGMIIPRPNYKISETDQKAVIWHDGKTETLIVSITFKGDSSEFAWIIPVPAKPDVEAGVDELFVSLDQLTRPVYSKTEPLPFGSLGLGTKEAERTTVTVIETKKVDIYDIAVLTAKDTSDLRKWLEDNGYTYPENREHLLKSYVNKDWYFVAAKVSTENLPLSYGLRTGHATPLKITFESEKIIYPLKISGMESSTTNTSNKVIAAHSFEDGTIQGWGGGRVTDGEAYHGKKLYLQSFRAPQSTVTPPTQNIFATRNISGLIVGKNYVFSAYVKASAGTTGYARLALDNSALSSQTLNFTGLDNWQRIELPFTAAKTYYQFNLAGEQITEGSTIFWDAVQIEEGSKASEFVSEVNVSTSTTYSQPADANVDILVYVFSKHKQEAPGWNIDYAGKIDSKTIKRLAVDDNGDPWIDTNKNMYLTRLSRSMKQSEMTSDVYFRQSANDNPVGSGSKSFFSGNVGLKILLVFGIPILAEVGLFLYVWYRRYRKSD